VPPRVPGLETGSWATMCPRICGRLPSLHHFRDELRYCHVSSDPVVCSGTTTCPRTRARLPYLCPLAWWAPIPPLVPRTAAGSCTSTCPRSHGWLPYVHPLWKWAPVPPRAPGLMAGFLLSAPLWDGFLCHHLSMDNWVTSFSLPLCGVGTRDAAKST
jgi:hypothetical protein